MSIRGKDGDRLNGRRKHCKYLFRGNKLFEGCSFALAGGAKAVEPPARRARPFAAAFGERDLFGRFFGGRGKWKSPRPMMEESVVADGPLWC